MSNRMGGILSLTLLVWGFLEVQGRAQGAVDLLPLRISIPFSSAWEGMLETLEAEGLEIEDAHQGEGVIRTAAREYASGALTESHIGKIGDRPKLIDGQWLKVRYRYEINLQLISATETIVTVYATIEALQREFLGAERWVPISSNGTLEERLLTRFGRLLFGESFELERPRKGFWSQQPSYLPDPSRGRPAVIGPERR